MNRFSTFFLGTLLGAGLMYVGLKYHIVRARDGFHMVPKSVARLSSFYADVRIYTADDWRDNEQLLVDITNSGSDELKAEAMKSAIGNTLDSAWDNWAEPTP